jgi:hypothetical protein
MPDPLKKFFIKEDADKAADEIYDVLDDLSDIFARYETKDKTAYHKCLETIGELIKEREDAYL